MQQQFPSGGVSPRNARLRGQSIIEYVLIITIIGLVVVFAGPKAAGAIRNQFGAVTETLDEGTSEDAFKDAVDIPDPEKGTAFAVYSEDDHSLMFYKRRGVPKVGDMFNDRRVTAVYTGFENQSPGTLPIEYEAGEWHEYKNAIQVVVVADSGIKPTSIGGWFGKFTALKSFDIKKLDMSLCTDAHYLFVGCKSLKTADLSGWNTPVLNSAGGIFEKCANLESVNLNGWNAPYLTDCWYMFQQTALKSVDLSRVNFGTIRLINGMFGYSAQLETINFGKNFNVAKVQNCSYAFMYCEKLNLDCSDWQINPNIPRDGFNTAAPGVKAPKAWEQVSE